MSAATNQPMRLESDIAPSLRSFVEVCRRKAERFLFPIQCPGWLRFQKGDVDETVWLHDISETGISFCMKHGVQVGMPIVISLNRHSDRPIAWGAIVVHSTMLGADDWRIGCKFAEPITPEFLESVL